MSVELFGPRHIVKTPMPDGGFVLASHVPLGNYAERITDSLAYWAAVDPSRVFLAQRANENALEWQSITYGEMHDKARAVGQYLLDNGCGPDRPVVILAENSIEAACLALGALYVGVPIAPITPAYAKVDQAHEKLRACLKLLQPALVYLDDALHCESLIKEILGSQVLIMRSQGGDTCASLQAAAQTRPSRVDAVNRKLTPDTVAKYLFTSGSTGLPKAVINTHRMLCANQKQLQLIFPFVKQEPPVLVDWLPWNHTFGGNEVFFLVMSQGGQLYIDSGKPVGQAIEATLQNLKSVSPTIHFNVPAGFEQIVARMETDTQLKNAFFARLRMVFYAGAGMPQRLWSRIESMALESTGRSVAVVTAWGATETAPLATGVHFESHRSDNIGVPVPGCEIRFAPVNGRMELRVRGPNVMPGYLGSPELTQTAFDELGFYRTGDAGSLAEANDAGAGIIFEGRIAEDFKLQTGTWVSVGRLRGLLSGALMPLASDVVVAGAGQAYLSLLVFLNPAAARACAQDEQASLEALTRHPKVLHAVQQIIDQHNAAYPGASMNIQKFTLMAQPPSPKLGEVTEKGSINQAAVLKNRAAVVQALYV